MRPARLPRSTANDCLYQFVSIVFEYFRAFVTILIPCGRRDRCFLFNISVRLFLFLIRTRLIAVVLIKGVVRLFAAMVPGLFWTFFCISLLYRLLFAFFFSKVCVSNFFLTLHV